MTSLTEAFLVDMQRIVDHPFISMIKLIPAAMWLGLIWSIIRISK